MLHIPIGTAVETAVSALDALAAVVLPITGCVLVKYRITYKSRVSSPGTPSDGADIKRRGVFIFNTSDTAPGALVEVPGILDAEFITTGPGAGYIIDSTLSDVNTFVSACIANNVANPFGDVSTSLNTAYLQSRV